MLNDPDFVRETNLRHKLTSDVTSRNHAMATENAVKASGKSLYELGKAFIDTEATRNDPYGDGDQSYVKADGPNDPGQRLRDLWCEGGCEGGFHELLARGEVPSIFVNSFFGNKDGVQREIDATEPDSPQRMHLLEGRVGVLRLTPLIACVVGARNAPGPYGTSEQQHDYIGVADVLCAAGCRVEAKDAAGYSAAYHCTTAFANPLTLAIFRFLCFKYDANISRNRFGDYSLYETIMYSREDVARTLIDHNVQFDRMAQRMIRAWPAGMPLLSLSCERHIANRSIKQGDFVRLLKSGSETINKKGRVSSYNYFTGEYSVELCDGGTVQVKRSQIEYCACEKCFKMGEKKCSKCLVVYYCSRDCQVAHWKVHKKVCTSDDSKKNHVFHGTLPVPNHQGEEKQDILSWTQTRDNAEVDLQNSGTVNGEEIIKGKKGADGCISFPVKIQMNLLNRENGNLLIYNKAKTFRAFINPKQDNLHKALYKIIDNKSESSQKVYMTCKYNPETKIGYIDVTTANFLPPQRF
mmetsp:Transcript_5760/g.8772  ORF Transcript_5760/g.8772 Transcript_5760/m.8772 type:complete len:523 (+) Transcript_5760:52-1620(+)